MSPIFFLVQLCLSKCRWTGNIVNWNFLKFSLEINILQLYLKGPDFPSWETLAEVRGLQVHPTETLGCECLKEIHGFNPPPLGVGPLGILDSLWSQLFANVSSCSFSHTTVLVLTFLRLLFQAVQNTWWNYRHTRTDEMTGPHSFQVVSLINKLLGPCWGMTN